MYTINAMDALKTLGMLALGLIGGGALAQSELPPPAASEGYVWRLAAGGDLLAAVPGSDRPGATLVLAPLEPALAADGANVATGIEGVLNIPVTQRSRLQFGAGQQWIVAAPARAAPWCGNLAGLLVYAASPSDCQAYADLGDVREPALARNQASVGYASDRFDLSLNYGVTSGNTLVPFSAGSTTPLGIDYLGLAGAGAIAADASGRDLGVSGTWRFDPLTALRVTASIGETTLRQPLMPAWTQFDHAALGLGVSRGPFSGSIVGRVVRGPANAAEQNWRGLDIGVAWRTPWQGELSFGARNLLSSGPEPGTVSPGESTLERDTARTPYVQYKQDL